MIFYIYQYFVSKQVQNEMDTISKTQIHLKLLKSFAGWLMLIPAQTLMSSSEVSKC